MPNKPGDSQAVLDTIIRVRRLIQERLAAAIGPLEGQADLDGLACGKLLRTHLAARLAAAAAPADAPAADACFAACEMAHTASLCHDDVIDAGLIRRAVPTLWRRTGCSAAVLIGDVLLCEALDLVLDVAGAGQARRFLAKVQQTVAAEAEQELIDRGRPLDAAACLRLARGKTGALFAFAAGAAGGDDPELSAALEEAGYRIGTAYQLADDLLDVIGAEAASGKTLGTDASRGTCTLAWVDGADFALTRQAIQNLCQTSVAGLAAWPAAAGAAEAFIRHDLGPLLTSQHLPIDLDQLASPSQTHATRPTDAAMPVAAGGVGANE